MKEATRDGLRFPVEQDDYEVPPELGETLKQRNQEMLDAKDRPAPEVSRDA